MAKLFYGDLRIKGEKSVQLEDGDTNIVSLKAASAMGADYTFTLPSAAGAANTVLVTSGSGTTSFASLVDANIDAAAAIAFSKMENLTTDRALVSDGSGDVSVSAVTATELGYVSGVTSAIQTQLDAKLENVVEDTTPQLGGDLDANGNNISFPTTGGQLRFTETGGGSEYVALAAPATIATNLTFTLPSTTTADGVMISDASGNLSVQTITNANVDAGAAIVESKLALDQNTADLATRALDNLASVAINTSLVSDTDATDDLGSAAIGWANGYINALHLDSNSQTTSLSGSASASASVAYTLPPAAPASNGYVLASTTGGVMSWVSNASSASFTADWVNGDGTTKAVAHNLTGEVIVQLYDIDSGQTIDVDTIDRVDSDNLSLTASEAPDSGGSGWRILIVKL